jgi:hypothetical protein
MFDEYLSSDENQILWKKRKSYYAAIAAVTGKADPKMLGINSRRSSRLSGKRPLEGKSDENKEHEMKEELPYYRAMGVMLAEADSRRLNNAQATVYQILKFDGDCDFDSDDSQKTQCLNPIGLGDASYQRGDTLEYLAKHQNKHDETGEGLYAGTYDRPQPVCLACPHCLVSKRHFTQPPYGDSATMEYALLHRRVGYLEFVNNQLKGLLADKNNHPYAVLLDPPDLEEQLLAKCGPIPTDETVFKAINPRQARDKIVKAAINLWNSERRAAARRFRFDFTRKERWKKIRAQRKIEDRDLTSPEPSSDDEDVAG